MALQRDLIPEVHDGEYYRLKLILRYANQGAVRESFRPAPVHAFVILLSEQQGDCFLGAQGLR